MYRRGTKDLFDHADRNFETVVSSKRSLPSWRSTNHCDNQKQTLYELLRMAHTL